MKNIIIRKKRNWGRYLLENTIIGVMWLIVSLCLGTVVLFVSGVYSDSLVTVCLLINVDTYALVQLTQAIFWLLSALTVFAFISIGRQSGGV
ncbi:hypothetical protein EQG49_00705 [Periweissella cryptocerci]|uniref:Uncharacterized protein n=1 Tax=Periweissella cryptocerci TaxID=2506420 RepID=A0A4P6YR36_9LACO|nr:hypothetical protein [Periweissella cryptocerci]QBO35074.1 hypothetical protein EQG49_00705 [Periweissella cryptocerci]